MKLPIEDVIDEIKETMSNNRYAVIQAPPGAGKTTLVPLSLLNEAWLSGKKIIMLEPRRIAVRASASRMADLISEQVGETVGYQIRMDRKIGPTTRIEVVTEGILTRRIQNDPSLEGVGLIIFDEFHERNLNSDLGLAFSLETCEVFSTELKILVMSATIDGDNVSKLMDNAPIITSEGKSWPVETRYVPSTHLSHPAQMIKDCASLIQKAIENEDGDILVFLPGVGEIKRVESILCGNLKEVNKGLSIIPLYGNLTKQEQDFAISPSVTGHRKIVIATPIAETSITIDGVSIVIDSGLMRVPKYFSGTGMSRLETIDVSKSSADQRRGRAGRTKPGICYRMWSEGIIPKEFNTPEILNTDLTGFVLELSAWGVSNISDLKLLDTPSESSVEQAKSILKDLGALDASGKITEHGKKMTGLGIHPRLAHMILVSNTVGLGFLACRIAAILSERDFIIFSGVQDNDIALRLEILESNGQFAGNIKLNKGVFKRVLRNASRFQKIINARYESSNINKAGSILAFAYPDRVIKLHKGSGNSSRVNGLMSNGMGVFLSTGNPLSSAGYAVAALLDGKPGNSKIFLGASYSKQSLMHDFKDKIKKVTTVKWDKKSKSVISTEELKYGAIKIEKRMIKKPDAENLASIMINGIKQMGLSCLPWSKHIKNYQARAVFLHKTGRYKNFPNIEDSELVKTLDVWLKPFIHGMSKASQLKRVDLKSALNSCFSWENQRAIKNDAPEKITVPSGSILPLKYPKGGKDLSPVLAVRLQEMFGLEETPCVAKGEPVVIHLLSPASRPVQVTKDLKNFWKTTYSDVKKELMGRYPKHHWPDDPSEATPTNRTKKKQKVKK
ncbi:MAG: ATP-dependent helicase HrpB [Desulfobacterales bacterium]|nr:ATP-dependent helicase HrpB [Desulfobacterales bacterium]MCP4159726.1 ATP-dependent helicase HrpB [Deltaproteobacteria bacterium]